MGGFDPRRLHGPHDLFGKIARRPGRVGDAERDEAVGEAHDSEAYLPGAEVRPANRVGRGNGHLQAVVQELHGKTGGLPQGRPVEAGALHESRQVERPESA